MTVDYIIIGALSLCKPCNRKVDYHSYSYFLEENEPCPMRSCNVSVGDVSLHNYDEYLLLYYCQNYF